MSILIGLGGRVLGVEPRSKVSMMIMRPPQHGHPRIRDKSIFVGNPDDIVPGTFGPGLPEIRAWTEQHFDFCGYITGLDPAKAAERAELRSRFGYGEDEKICIVTVDGSGVGAPLLRRIADAFPALRRQLPGLRMIMVAGPRIDTS